MVFNRVMKRSRGAGRIGVWSDKKNHFVFSQESQGGVDQAKDDEGLGGMCGDGGADGRIKGSSQGDSLHGEGLGSKEGFSHEEEGLF